MPKAATITPLTPEQKEFAEENFPLVLWVVKRIRRFRRWTLPQDEMVQAGSVGLLRAVAGYKPIAGAFSTYARQAIERHIEAAEMDRDIIHIPKYLQESSRKQHRYRSRLSACRRIASLDWPDEENTLHPCVLDEYVDPDDEKTTRDAVKKALMELPEFDRSVAEGVFIQGKTIWLVAKENGAAWKRVRAAKAGVEATLRAKLQKYA